ncbi:unnamed protein product [Durusdinium trenchii]|uniref:Vps41 beta-propeller domain-containing protein n=1 Tax=Durusdinium trenchii TaxID=1381693 RepID=A0ABP0RU59_9DINO
MDDKTLGTATGGRGEDFFCILHGELLVAALPGCVKVFRGTPGAWSDGWELRRIPESIVYDVSIDVSGTFVASAWQDGTIAVDAVETIPGAQVRSWKSSMPKPVLSIAIYPGYAEAPGRRVVCCGGQDGRLVLSRRGALEAKHATLHLGEGPISCVRWRGPLVAWATAKSVKLVDVDTHQKVGFIPCSSAQTGGGHLCWLSDTALLIGWDQEVLLVELRQMGDGVAVHFAEVLRKMPVPGELVRQLAQLDSALTPCPTALMAALARWPRRAKPTAALMANLQRALRPGEKSLEGCLSWEPQGDEPEEQAAEVLASLHETRGDVETAARLLARAKSPRVFPLLKKHLPAGHFSGAAAALPQLVALDTAEAIRLAAEFPSTFPPADVLAALVPLGECWELRYLRILSETAPDVANLGRLVELMAALQPHRLASLLDKLLQEQAVGAQEALEVSWAAGALDASAVAVAALGHTREAFDLLLQQGLSKALELEGKAQGDAFELKEHLLTLAAQDAHICGRLLNENDLPIKAVEIFRSIPPGLAVPGISVLALKALQRAESVRTPGLTSLCEHEDMDETSPKHV